jgi:hypothetical protein
MSRHHNTKHEERSGSNYAERTGVMGTGGKLTEIEGRTGLRYRQEQRIKATCTAGENHNGHECNGSPFPKGDDSPGEKLLRDIFEGQ